MKKNKETNRWLILLAGFTFNFCLSSTSAFSIFIKPMTELNGWTMSSFSLAYTFYNIVLAVVGIIVGVIAPKIKPVKLMYFGAIMFSLGWIITGFSNQVWMAYLGFGLIAGIGGGCIYNFSVTNTIKWFPDKKGFVSGLLLGGAAVGPVFCAPVATAILGNIGVLNAYKILGVIYGLLMFSVAWLVKVPESNYMTTNSTGNVVAQNNVKNYTWKEMISTKMFYMLYVIFIFACSSSMIMMNSAAIIGQEQAGISTEMAAVCVSLLALSNFAGRIFFGSLSDKLGRYKTLLIAMSINFVAMITLPNITTAFPFIIVMCLVGACGGALLVMFPPMTSDSFGTKNSSLNYSIMFSAYSIAALLGPQIAAHYRETTGSYGPAFIWAAGLTIVSMIILLFVMKIKKSEVVKSELNKNIA